MTLTEWLEEMKRLDTEATEGPWDSESGVGDFNIVYPSKSDSVETVCIVGTDTRHNLNHNYRNDSSYIAHSRTELPRAVKIIELLLNEQCRATECTEDMKVLEKKIQKILEWE